jgi:hypothetical protein
MLSEGAKQSEIAKKLKLTKGRISQIAKKLNKETDPLPPEDEERGADDAVKGLGP